MSIMNTPGLGMILILFVAIVMVIYLAVSKNNARKDGKDAVKPAAVVGGGTPVQSAATASVITAVIAAAVTEYQKNQEGV